MLRSRALQFSDTVWLFIIVELMFNSSHPIVLSQKRKTPYSKINIFKTLGGCLFCVFKQSFSVFKQHFTHFNVLFHQHVFPQIFSNNNFLFLNTCTFSPSNNNFTSSCIVDSPLNSQLKKKKPLN